MASDGQFCESTLEPKPNGHPELAAIHRDAVPPAVVK